MPDSSDMVARYSDLLNDLQDDVKTVEFDRGFHEEGLSQKALILAEEVFEVIKVLRYRSGVATSRNDQETVLADELADLVFVSAAIANRVPVKLSEAIKLSSIELGWPAVMRGPDGGSREHTLQLALTLASEVLTVVSAAQDPGTLVCGGSTGVPDNARGVISSALGRIATIVEIMAAADSIDMGEAIHKKLQKDQLRLWGVPAEQ